MTDYSIDIIKDTSYTIELNEQGPQGIQGERGVQGPEGPIGPKGDKGDVGEKGDTGDTGVSVVGVEEVSKVGLVTTYRMKFSNGEYFDYQVTDGSLDGLTRETIINIIGYEPASYTSVEGLTTRVSTLEERVEDLTTSKFPNVVIIGTPHVEGGQVSNFSSTDYLQFPFVDISRGLPFDIYFSFTTGSDVVTQQNVLDSYFGIALAIQNSKGVMALSSNGTSWDIGNITGTNTILPNTTYYVKCGWTGTQYNASLSTNDTTYVPDMVLDSTLTTNKTTIFIGGSPDLFGAGTSHPFKGTINFNNSRVDVQGTTVWEGMADVGLASRANVSLNNLDEVGEKRFTDIQIALDGKQDKGTSSSGLELCDIGMALYVDETKGLRRRLNGSIMDITANYQAFLTRLKKITTLYPSLVCTESEWQTTKTMSKLGQCGKFVYNYGADGTTITSIRLPLVININGLVDMANAGLIKDESLPNIKGTVLQYRNDTPPNSNGAFSYSDVSIDSAGSGGNATPVRSVYFNASRSSSTYQNNAPVQQEAIQYPYFIQIATGSETENNIVNDIELNNPFSLFDSKYSDHKLNNLSWLKSEGQWNSKAAYPTAYDELLKEYNNPDRLATFNKDAFEVVGSPTITEDGIASGFSDNDYLKVSSVDVSKPFKFSGTFTTGADIYHSQAVFGGIIGSTQFFILGVHSDGYPVIYYPRTDGNTWIKLSRIVSANTTYHYTLTFDGTNLTFNLTDGASYNLTITPTNFDASKLGVIPTLYIGRNASGTYIMQPDATIDLKQFSITVDGKKVFSGVKSMVKLSTETYTDYDFVLNTADETFRLPLKNHTADDGNSVLTLYYYVGETVQNANLIDAGRIGEILPTKTDMQQAAKASMPSSRYIDLTLGASGTTYTAPANGWVSAMFRNSTYCNLHNKTVRVNAVDYGASSKDRYASIPISKGHTFQLYYSGNLEYFQFIYAEGEV